MERTQKQDQSGDQDPDLDTDQERLAHLGAFGIVWESIKLCYWTKARYFFAILFTLGIPFLLQLTVGMIFNLNLPYYYASSLFPPPQPQPDPQPAAPPAPAAASASASASVTAIHDQNRLWGTLYVRRDLQIVVDILWPLVIIFVTQILVATVSQVCRALWVAGTTYTVGLSYSRRRLLSSDDLSNSSSSGNNSDGCVAVSSFIADVLRRAPRLWYRLMRTWLWGAFLLAIPYFMFICSLLATFTSFWGPAFFLYFICSCFFMVSAFAVAVVRTVAEPASVLDPEESCYGSEAFKKSMALLKNKRGLVVRVYSLWMMLMLPPAFILPVSWTKIPDPDVHPWDPVRILRIVIYCIVLWVMNQSQEATSGVLYASLKAYHGESIVGLSPVGRTPRNHTPASRRKDVEWV